MADAIAEVLLFRFADGSYNFNYLLRKINHEKVKVRFRFVRR